jgi:hypothetical protein
MCNSITVLNYHGRVEEHFPTPMAEKLMMNCVANLLSEAILKLTG